VKLIPIPIPFLSIQWISFMALNLEPSSGNHSHQATNEPRLISFVFCKNI